VPTLELCAEVLPGLDELGLSATLIHVKSLQGHQHPQGVGDSHDCYDRTCPAVVVRERSRTHMCKAFGSLMETSPGLFSCRSRAAVANHMHRATTGQFHRHRPTSETPAGIIGCRHRQRSITHQRLRSVSPAPRPAGARWRRDDSGSCRPLSAVPRRLLTGHSLDVTVRPAAGIASAHAITNMLGPDAAAAEVGLRRSAGPRSPATPAYWRSAGAPAATG
jgi:hypothetical protein